MAANETAPSEKSRGRTILGINPLKMVFAMEYVLQGLANPFQGITYHPFFRHFRFHYGLTEAATQNYFSKSYLAWSFKPIIGFFIDAFGKTKVILTFLLSSAIIFYLLTPLIDVSAAIFFWFMFALSVFLAATDVAVDRATVVAGDEEAKASGKSKSTTVGLNQAICWAAIYGTGIVAAVFGGYVAEHVDFDLLMVMLGLVPLMVLMFVLFLPKDQAEIIPLKKSVKNFWDGLNTGPILWVVVFYFLFHFQPAMGALWTNHLMENLHFSQTQIGLADGASYVGFFLGVLLFAGLGIRWQDALGLKKLFKIFIIASVVVNLTQYALVDPWFTNVTNAIAGVLPFAEVETVRLVYLSAYNVVLATFQGFVRMSTFSLVGAVIPVAAAGSLFAGFMSVANLAYSFSYSTGSWLYDNGLNYGVVRSIQNSIFGIPAAAGDELSISMLILIGSLAYLLSFGAAHMLPDRRETISTQDVTEYMIGPEHYRVLGDTFLRRVNWATVAAILLATYWLCTVYGVSLLKWNMNYLGDIITAALLSFFGIAFVRKVFLDWVYKGYPKSAPDPRED